MRASQRRQRVIEVSADRAWAVVTRADVLHHWFPGLTSCVVDGSARAITTRIGVSLVEDIVTNDPLQRRFQYKITGGFFKEHLASIDVIELAPDRCLVTYASDADPDTMAIVLGGVMEEALAELARQLEADAGPALDAIRKEP